MKKAAHHTMRDVAKAAGVSTMTVSRALKPGSSMAPGTRRKVLDCIDSMNYVPDHKASSLSSRKSGIVVALIPSLDNPHFAQTIQALSEILEIEGLQVLLGHTGYCQAKEQQILRTLLRHRPECVVLACDGHTDKTRAMLEAASVPVIEMWETPPDPLGLTVGFSNHAAAEELTLSLISQGYSRIGFLGENSAPGNRGTARFKGYQSAMKTAGLDASRVLLDSAPPITVERGAKGAKRLVSAYPDLDCLFCVSDLAAFGAMHTFQAMGKRIPDDIAIAGFGDFEISRYATPGISSVSANPRTIGENVGELIRQMLRVPTDPSELPLSSIAVPYSIELRSST